jgi:hypothetical protein
MTMYHGFNFKAVSVRLFQLIAINIQWYGISTCARKKILATTLDS